MAALDPPPRPSQSLDAHQIIIPAPEQQRQPSRSSASSSSHHTMRGKDHDRSRPKANSDASRGTRTSSSAHSGHIGEGKVRSLPPWIDSFEEGDDQILPAKHVSHLLSAPSRAYAAQHHYAPAQVTRKISLDGYIDEFDEGSHGLVAKKAETGFFGGHKSTEKGRKFDQFRDAEPVIVQTGQTSRSPWSTFVRSSMYGPALNEDSEIVSSDVLRQQTPGYDKPWRGDLKNDDDPENLSGLLHSKRRRKTLWKRIQKIFLQKVLVPLIFRITILTTSIIALGLASSVHHLSNNYSYRQSPSATMAIAVDVVAIPYILFVTYDEYTSQPLGLRSAKTKISLVLLDLFFIIFESANLALAFASLTVADGACQTSDNGYNPIVCDRTKALCGILFIALLSWTLTFAVSIFRLVERVTPKDKADKD